MVTYGFKGRDKSQVSPLPWRPLPADVHPDESETLKHTEICTEPKAIRLICSLVSGLGILQRKIFL